MNNIQKVAAIQIELVIGNPELNIVKCLSRLEEALKNGAQYVALPEFISTPICLVEGVNKGILNPQNHLVDGLISLCRKYGAAAGGSYLENRNGAVHNTYTFVDKHGTLFKHDKDIPTMVEQAFYIGGTSDRVFNSASGRIGVAMCWEMIRSQTVARLVNQVDIILAGTTANGVGGRFTLAIDPRSVNTRFPTRTLFPRCLIF